MQTDLTPVFLLKDVTFRYPGEHVALDAVSFGVAPGESVCLLGANGSGKSSLLRLMDGLVVPTAGSLDAYGSPLTPAALANPVFSREFRRRVSLLFQDPDAQLFSPTVRDEIAFGPLQLGLPPDQVEARSADVMAMVGIVGLAQRSPDGLSGGEKKRVAMAALLATDPDVLLLDEPFAGLDPRGQVWLIELLVALQARGKTIVAATHDLAFAHDFAERAIVLSEDHRLAGDAACAQVLADDDLLLRVNLIHEHAHRHGSTVHRHPHRHGVDHDHGP